MLKHALRVTVVSFLAVSLAACATIYNPATGNRETLISTPVEVLLGNVAKTQMGLFSLRMGNVPDREFERVQAIGQRIAQVSDRKDVQYQFGVVQEKSLNAFTLPGGTIYVHSGLVEKADDDELAAVLGHEMGHAAARHVAKHVQADLGFTALMAIAGAAGGSPEAARLANSIYGLISTGYSRRDELESDRLGIKYAMAAGYNPEGMVSFFEKMLQAHPEDAMDRAAEWGRTHPLTSTRIAEAKKEIEKIRQRKFCPVCGRSYGPEQKFCERDGTALKQVSIPKYKVKLERFCPQCGRVYSPRMKFCETDGTLLKEREVQE